MPLLRDAHTAGMTVLDVALADLGEAETAASRVESIGPAPLPSRLGVAALAQAASTRLQWRRPSSSRSVAQGYAR